MLDFIGYAPIFVDFSGRFNNRAIRMIEYLSNTGSPLASKSFGLIRCYSGECGYVAILFSQLSHRHILLQIHPFAKIFTEVTSPKSVESANSTTPADMSGRATCRYFIALCFYTARNRDGA